MNKIIEVKGGGGCISIQPMTEWDFAAIFHGREMLILENMLDGEIRRGYNPNIDKQPTASREIKTSRKKQTAKRLKAKTINR